MTTPHKPTDPLLVLQGKIAELPLNPKLAREALRIEMENYSENHSCASWLNGLEFSLWQKVKELRERGPLRVDAEVYACMLLAEIAGGWWYWPDEPAQKNSRNEFPCFIEMRAWLAHFDEHVKRRSSRTSNDRA